MIVDRDFDDLCERWENFDLAKVLGVDFDKREYRTYSLTEWNLEDS